MPNVGTNDTASARSLGFAALAAAVAAAAAAALAAAEGVVLGMAIPVATGDVMSAESGAVVMLVVG